MKKTSFWRHSLFQTKSLLGRYPQGSSTWPSQGQHGGGPWRWGHDRALLLRLHSSSSQGTARARPSLCGCQRTRRGSRQDSGSCAWRLTLCTESASAPHVYGSEADFHLVFEPPGAACRRHVDMCVVDDQVHFLTEAIIG